MAPAPPSNPGSAADIAHAARQALRRRLLAAREAFATRPEAQAAQVALGTHLARLLREIEPELLGVYWPVRGEFNAIAALEADGLSKLPLALPFAQRTPPSMHYRAWDGRAPEGVDDCGLPAPGLATAVVPDVALLPCVGYTRSGFRLGYGGGYFDRWVDQHPQVTTIGVAWSIGEVADDAFAARPHDRALMLVLTEHGVIA